MVRLKARGKWVVIREEKGKGMVGGIYIPETVRKKLNVGTVVSGQGLHGERVVYSPHAGTRVQVEGEDMVMVEVEDVFAVVTDG